MGRSLRFTIGVKDYVVNIWETCKLKLYGDDSSQSQTSTGDSGDVTGLRGHSGEDMCQGGEPDTGEFQYSSVCVNVCCFACDNGCMVDGMCVFFFFGFSKCNSVTKP